MDVILKQNVKGLGKQGQKVKVADGYARNFLFPKKLAVVASDTALKEIHQAEGRVKLKQERNTLRAQELAEKIKTMSCTISKQVGEGDKLFGSVNVSDILKSLETDGIKLEKKQVFLEQPIKNLGIFPVKIKLAPQIETVLKVWVVK